MRRQILTSFRLLVLLTVLCGLLYPLALTGVAKVLFPDQAAGSLVRVDGQVVGSSLLGQGFSGAEWFHGRPSAAGAAAAGQGVGPAPAVDPSDVSLWASGPSNLGPTNRVLIDSVAERSVAYRTENGLAADAAVPVDAVTASGSGVDPQISVANARLQAQRVARVRGLALREVLALVDRHTRDRSMGFLGEPGVEVLALNLAVEAAAAR